MRNILALIILLFSIFDVYGQSKIQVVQPYVIIKVIEQESIDDIETICNYYNYGKVSEEESIILFKDINGNTLTVSADKSYGSGSSMSLTTNQKYSDIVDALKKCGYIQIKNLPDGNNSHIKGLYFAKGKRLCIVGNQKPTTIQLIKTDK